MAISTMKLNTSVNEGFETKVECSQNFTIDQPTAMGGNGAGPNPLEVFLSSLGACICAIGRIIANQKRLDVRGIHVKVEGDIDKDYLLGKTIEGRAGFTEIRTFVDVDADMTIEEKEAYIQEVESRCPIADNILKTSVVKATVTEKALLN